MNSFFTDAETGTISYQMLIDDINNKKFYNRYCYSDSFYEIFNNIIISIVAEKEIFLLDKYIFDSYGFSNEIILCDIPNIIDIHHLEQLLLKSKKWSVTLFTSGTTGVPKKVKHTYDTITRNIKIRKDFRNDIWGYAYNPTHMAGVQVFLQAVFNLNHMVRLYNYPNEIQYTLIQKHRINKLSGTPTFYKMLYKNGIYFDFVKNVTLGGEKSNSSLLDLLKKMFPIAKIKNIYASTEIGTLLLSESEIFTVKEEMMDKIKIIGDQLYVSTDYLGIIETRSKQDEYYPTGDIVEVLTNEPLTFIFKGRTNDIINIAGNKVYPQEIENIIQKFDGVKFCKVYSKHNSVTGNVLVCDIVLESNCLINEREIRKKLSEFVPSYMIPRLFNFIDKIETTRTGKIRR